MASTLNASTSGVGGVITTADNSGDLNIQSGGSTKIAVTSAGANVVGTLTVNGVAPASGKVLQVVNSTYSTLVSSSSSTFANTGLTATITPTNSTSKVLVLVNCAGCGKDSNTALGVRVVRGGSTIITIEGAAADNGLVTTNNVGSVSTSYLDSPATTSATTYTVQIATVTKTGTVYLNNAWNAATSTITLMEIAA